jgi:porphobilinogen synthase
MIRRPRRNRKSNSIREAISETRLSPKNLVHPIFLTDGTKQKTEIKTMPDFFRYSHDLSLFEIEECLNLGITHFILFPEIAESKKDRLATYSYSQDNFYLKSIREIKSKFPESVIITDVAMDPYSSEGHDGIFENDKILNDETLEILGKMSLAQASAGADILGPSDMMDGRVFYLREILDKNDFKDTSIMSYAVKYASSFYGPFRDALNSAPKKGDKKTYQMNPANSREAILEAELDFNEGADFLMVKPAIHFLDIIHQLKNKFLIPIVCYHVSGEYAMLKFAAKNGAVDEKKAVEETFISMKRAGADLIISYYSKFYAEEILKK